MKLYINNTEYIDTSKPIDISIPIKSNEGVLAWNVDYPTISPVKDDDYVCLVKEGGSVNFRNIFFNPHANGTHTECVGHISKEIYSVNNSLQESFFNAQLVSVKPRTIFNASFCETDHVIMADDFSINPDVEAIIIRTLPNTNLKKQKKYSGTNPAYLSEEAILKIAKSKIQHLLIDLPSIDRENDGGILNSHHIFWNFPSEINLEKTITEMIYIPNQIKDGLYILNIQIAPFENDASPSKPLIYEIKS